MYPILVEIKDIIKTYKTNKKEQTNISIFLSVIFIVIGAILLKYGGDFVVDYSVEIANYFKISQRVIGLTIVAIGTAMPELVTSIIAIIKKDTDLAVGNLVGSCVLNLLLILGLGAVITPLEFSNQFIQNLFILLGVNALIWLFTFMHRKNYISRMQGVILLIIFALYISNLFI